MLREKVVMLITALEAIYFLIVHDSCTNIRLTELEKTNVVLIETC